MRKNCLIRYATVCRCVVKNIYTARRRKAPLPLRFGAFMGRRLNFSAGREYASAPLTGFNWPRPLPRPQTIPTRRLLNIERRSDSNQGSHYLEFSALPTELPGRTDSTVCWPLLKDGQCHCPEPHLLQNHSHVTKLPLALPDRIIA